MMRRKCKAGILLYALLMLAAFSFLLTFYLQRQVARERLVRAYQEQERAYAMAHLVKESALKKEGEVRLKGARGSYRYTEAGLEVEIGMEGHGNYSYRFRQAMPPSKESKESSSKQSQESFDGARSSTSKSSSSSQTSSSSQ